jgi:hypothetical protein
MNEHKWINYDLLVTGEKILRRALVPMKSYNMAASKSEPAES